MIGTRAVEYHQGQRSYAAPKAGHMTAADQSDQTVENPLAKRPSTYDDSKSERLSLGSKPRTGDASPRAAPESPQASPLKPVNSNLFKIAAVVRLQDRVLQGQLSPLDPFKIFPQGGGVRLARR